MQGNKPHISFLLEATIWMYNPHLLVKHSLLLQVHRSFSAEKLETKFIVVRRNHGKQMLLNTVQTAADLGSRFEQIVGYGFRTGET